MVLYHVEYKVDDDTGISGYQVRSNQKQLPPYFLPTFDRGVAHDIVDHLTHNPQLHPIVDELVAIGVAWFREQGVDNLRHDVEGLLYSFYEEEVSEIGSSKDEDYVTKEIFKIHYTQPIDEELEAEVQHILDTYSYSTPGEWLNKYRKHLERHVLKALTKGYRMGEKLYRYQDNAVHIHRSIEGYVKKYGGQYPNGDSAMFRFFVDRKHGNVRCQHKLPYERFYWGDMIDFDKYKNTQTYPNKGDFLTPLVSKLNETPLTRTEYDAKLLEVHKQADMAYQAALSKYRAEDAKLAEQFWLDMREYHAYDDLEPHQIQAIESMAWDRGHYAGYSEVHAVLPEIVDFANTLLGRL